ncbi:ribonuclease E inhibitor RraB [Roseateles saccharophilus]|uniref:Regulator of ribonuclease activity B n=1 Tax=Roseateles saccharophilus TaxID=304 RepID=A0A4R3UBU4_ROSSA|nr:ribonuclease E inhibitor RraB [Roseateles saccharophilus]MDG0835443.1 ribonuclease E inhibitor RraB [Roseateles saccharophilus]TCU86332.1 regulator of ribonuclease activity B [Roseateles saccharophilus]
MNRTITFPDDENGDVLRRMQANGDDLLKPRDIDFTVVLPDEPAALSFSAQFSAHGYQVKVNESGVVDSLPWDVVVVKHMAPTHSGITQFEAALQAAASAFAGRNDGWGCFEQ